MNTGKTVLLAQGGKKKWGLAKKIPPGLPKKNVRKTARNCGHAGQGEAKGVMS